MSDQLDSQFDLIVVGTGLTEAIVASAASRIGKTVLHIDSNDFYGGYWASFNLNNLSIFGQKCQSNKESDSSLCKIGTQITNVKEFWKQCNFENLDENIFKEEILKDFRRFNIDIAPKLLYSRGSLVELLISSNISRYAEFRAVDHILTLIDNSLKVVPSSRSDVFNSKELNIVEKRLLMKLLTNCLSYNENNDEWKNNENKTFVEYLNENNLTPKLTHYIMHAIAMYDDQTTFKNGIENTKKFLLCLGRYGNSPFLFPMYGCGEIPQCFCRLCAVFGGIYCLQRSIDEINFTTDNNEKTFSSITSQSHEIKAKNLVLGHGYATEKILTSTNKNENSLNSVHRCGGMSRGIFLSKKPLGEEQMNKGGGGVSFLRLTTEENKFAYVIQLSHYSGTCPKNCYLFHITTEMQTEAETDIKPFYDKIFTEQTEIFYSFYFNIPKCIKCSSDNYSLPHNIHLSCGPFYEIDYDLSIQQAKTIFLQMYPNDEFLPRAPDPEEIIIGGEDENDVEEVTEDVGETNEDITHQEVAVEATEEEQAVESPEKETIAAK